MEAPVYLVPSQVLLNLSGSLPFENLHKALNSPGSVVALNLDGGLASLKDLADDTLPRDVTNKKSSDLSSAPMPVECLVSVLEAQVQLISWQVPVIMLWDPHYNQ